MAKLLPWELILYNAEHAPLADDTLSDKELRAAVRKLCNERTRDGSSMLAEDLKAWRRGGRGRRRRQGTARRATIVEKDQSFGKTKLDQTRGSTSVVKADFKCCPTSAACKAAKRRESL